VAGHNRREAAAAAAAAAVAAASAPPSAAFAAAATRLFASSRGATLSDMLNPVHSAFDASLKSRWAAMPRAQRALVVEADRAALARRAALASEQEAQSFPFPVAADDHCETDRTALEDAAALLRPLARALGVAPEALRLYDPYYCAGASAQHLRDLGFPHVHSVKEDFYAAAREGRCPAHDVLVTNPAYSGDHMPRLLDFAAAGAAAGRPFLLLMPAYVAGKDWFAAARARVPGGVCFVFPPKRYTYWTPHGLREREKTQAHSSALGSRTSPFVSFWFCGLGAHAAAVLAAATGPDKRLRVAHSVEDLPPSVRPVIGGGGGGGGGEAAGAAPEWPAVAAAGAPAVWPAVPTAAWKGARPVPAAAVAAAAAPAVKHATAGSWKAAADDDDDE
jgi:hypothetical protein